MLLLWIVFVCYASCVLWYRVCSLQPCGHLLGEGWSLGCHLCFLCCVTFLNMFWSTIELRVRLAPWNWFNHKKKQCGRELSGPVVGCLTRDWMAVGSSLTGVTVLCHWAKRINPSLVLVQPRKTHPYKTERLLMGRNEINQTKQTNKQKIRIGRDYLRKSTEPRSSMFQLQLRMSLPLHFESI